MHCLIDSYWSHSVRLLTLTITLQRGPLQAPIEPVACSYPSPGLTTMGGMGSNI